MTRNLKRVAITGANGVIGTVLRNGLSEFEITPIDLPGVDVRNYRKLLEVLRGHSAIIHLAWDANVDNFRSGGLNTDNLLMAYNVYRGAVEARVPRVIMASSVHADNFYAWKGPGLLSPGLLPVPDSPYGASKVFMEALGRSYAAKGLEVVCIRFGGVNSGDEPPAGDYCERVVWLSHKDCTALVRKCVNAKAISGNYAVVYAVSNNAGRIHDYSNPLGWVPGAGK